MSNNLDAPILNMLNNLDAPILNMLNKLIGHQIYKIIIIKHYTNLHYFNVSVGQCETHLSVKLYNMILW